MVADGARELLRRGEPIFRESYDTMRRLLVAGAVAAHETAGGVVDLKHDFITGLRKIVIKDGAGGGVLSHGGLRRPGCVVLLVTAEAISSRRTEQGGGLLGG